jgi:hypothetical protein
VANEYLVDRCTIPFVISGAVNWLLFAEHFPHRVAMGDCDMGGSNADIFHVIVREVKE